MSDEELRQLIASNAKAIEALTDALTQEGEERRREYEEWRKDRNRLYEYVGRIASAQAGFYEVQADYYRRLEEMDSRQAQIIEILNRLTQKDE